MHLKFKTSSKNIPTYVRGTQITPHLFRVFPKLQMFKKEQLLKWPKLYSCLDSSLNRKFSNDSLMLIQKWLQLESNSHNLA